MDAGGGNKTKEMLTMCGMFLLSGNIKRFLLHNKVVGHGMNEQDAVRVRCARCGQSSPDRNDTIGSQTHGGFFAMLATKTRTTV